MLLTCRQTPSFAASAAAAKPAEPAPGRMVAAGLPFAVPGREEPALLKVPDWAFESVLPAAYVANDD